MKRATFLLSVILLMSLALTTFTVSATDYSVSQTDVTVTIDDSVWYVFTRDNLKDNPELDELGITYDYLYNSMQANSVYIDAILFYDDGNYIEMFLRKTTNGALDNLSDLSNDAVDVFAQALTENLGLDSYTIYETDYTYVLMEYIDQGLYLYEFLTIVDGDNYTFTFQASSPYIASEYEEMKGIVDSAKFGADSASDNNNSQNNNYISKTIVFDKCKYPTNKSCYKQNYYSNDNISIHFQLL